MSTMLARVVTIQVKPEKMDECIRIFKEVNAPSIAARPGFDHGHWWVDRTSGRATSVTFWENETNERASRAKTPRLVGRVARELARGARATARRGARPLLGGRAQRTGEPGQHRRVG